MRSGHTMRRSASFESPSFHDTLEAIVNTAIKYNWKYNVEASKDVWNSKSWKMTSFGEIGLIIRTYASPKWDKTRCSEE